MDYYLYRPDANNFAGIGFSLDDNERIVDVHYTDMPLISGWMPLVAHEFEDNPEAQGHFPSLSNFWRIPVMSELAWDILRPLIGYCCEALPILHPSSKPFFIIHVMETIDCLNYAESQLTRNETTGRVNRIDRYSFRPGMLAGKRIFKLPIESGAELIVDGQFRNIVEDNDLVGLRFEELRLS